MGCISPVRDWLILLGESSKKEVKKRAAKRRLKTLVKRIEKKGFEYK